MAEAAIQGTNLHIGSSLGFSVLLKEMDTAAEAEETGRAAKAEEMDTAAKAEEMDTVAKAEEMDTAAKAEEMDTAAEAEEMDRAAEVVIILKDYFLSPLLTTCTVQQHQTHP